MNQEDLRKSINPYFPPIESNQLRNIISQYQDENLLHILIQILRRFKQTTERVEELIKFILAKWENTQKMAIQNQLNEEIIISLIETKFFRQALIENGNHENSFLKKYDLLTDISNMQSIFSCVEDKINKTFTQREFGQMLKDERETIHKKNSQSLKSLQLPKGQRVISLSLNIQDHNHIEKLYRKNQQILSNLGIKVCFLSAIKYQLESKKSTIACQTESSEIYQIKKQRKSEQKLENIEMLSFYENFGDQGPYLQYLPSCETEEILTQNITQFVSEIDNFNKVNKPNFEKLISEITLIVTNNNIFQGATLDVYGSYATELCLPHSDIDLVIKIPNSQGIFLPDLLRNLDLILRECKFIEETKCITQSTTPVVRVKCSKQYLNKRLDISIQENKHNGLHCVKLIKHYISIYEPLKPLALVLKQFLYCSDLSDTYSGGLSSYGLILMIVSFLQSYQNDTKNWPSLGTLLIEFLYVYGCELDYAGKTIYPAQPQEQPEITIFFDPENFVYCSQQSLVIIDPINKINNVGRPTYNVSKLKLAFTIAFAKLLTFDSNQNHPLKHFLHSARNIQFSLHSVLINQYKAYADQVMYGNPNHY